MPTDTRYPTLPESRITGDHARSTPITLATQTTFAELLQRCLDAEFDALYDERGSFTRKRVKGRMYWYHQRKIERKGRRLLMSARSRTRAITDRVQRFADIKSDFKGRQEMVRAHRVPPDLPTPDSGSRRAVVDAMWKAGFFRLRGVLVGTVAFQAYAGPLGMRLSGRPLQTQDADFAQFWGISRKYWREHAADAATCFASVDASFQQVPHIDDPFVSVRLPQQPALSGGFSDP